MIVGLLFLVVSVSKLFEEPEEDENPISYTFGGAGIALIMFFLSGLLLFLKAREIKKAEKEKRFDYLLYRQNHWRVLYYRVAYTKDFRDRGVSELWCKGWDSRNKNTHNQVLSPPKINAQHAEDNLSSLIFLTMITDKKVLYTIMSTLILLSPPHTSSFLSSKTFICFVFYSL